MADYASILAEHEDPVYTRPTPETSTEDEDPACARLTPVTSTKDEDLVCARATSEQITLHFENNSQMWSAPLSRIQYLHLKRELANSDINAGNTFYWVLFKPSEPKLIICSCSVYLRSAIVNIGRGMEPVKAAVIADIFTHADFRRKGMATRLLTKVKEMPDETETDRIEFSIIYSGVSNELYEKLG